MADSNPKMTEGMRVSGGSTECRQTLQRASFWRGSGLGNSWTMSPGTRLPLLWSATSELYLCAQRRSDGTHDPSFRNHLPVLTHSLSTANRPANPNQHQYGAIGQTDQAGEADAGTNDATVHGCRENNGGEGATPQGPGCLMPGSRGTRRRLKRPLVPNAQTAEVNSRQLQYGGFR